MVFTLVGTIPFGDTICPREFHLSLPGLFQGHAVQRQGTPARSAPRTGASRSTSAQLAPIGVGILYMFAMSGQGIIGAAIAGWSSDNKFSLMGALRAASQMVSYEVTLGMSLIGAMMIYGTVRLDDMVRWQEAHTWGIFVQPVAFFLFFAAAVAENKRIPFDLPEAESELVSGYFTEYAGMKFGMFYFAEYAEVVTGSMLLVTTIFLGGWAMPFFHRDGLHDRLRRPRDRAPPLAALLGDRPRRPRLLRQGARRLLDAGLRPVDAPALPLRPADEARLADASPGVAGQHLRHRRHPTSAMSDNAGGRPWRTPLRVVADLTQAAVALWGITYLAGSAVLGFFAPVKHIRSVLGSSAAVAARHGGTKSGPMQA